MIYVSQLSIERTGISFNVYRVAISSSTEQSSVVKGSRYSLMSKRIFTWEKSVLAASEYAQLFFDSEEKEME